ncbi:HAD-IIIA family hydrolase [Aeromicrobium duanguangcaii]|uniref:D,D-heptose 1,7-bisphosphate phosphatase n=1 Tax=Aeromicrobium duanguangcaii TaxID=2968086 RepID=A0ABY5KAD8_9ACTN|nr:HAD-IIIA family hydrolase [Aeromicrobium duanguangcaii]UUI67399.1 HAD-IIIA family hydrolase [Aeromicrobium duanguangcaii]
MWTDEALLGLDATPIAPPAGPVPWDLVLLDRDGTLNIHRPGYISSPAELRLRPGAARAVGALTRAGMRTVLVTNQRGLATGRLTRDQLVQVHRALVARLARAGGRLDGIEVCPHERGTCDCRKPLPGMLLQAMARAPWARPERVVMVGDQPSDEAAAQAAGVAWLDVGQAGLEPARIADVLIGRDPHPARTVVLRSRER